MSPDVLALASTAGMMPPAETEGMENLASHSSKKSTSALALGSVTSVIFNEVAVYFSEEEWNLLELWQKEQYSNVMRDIHAALLSLGYTILHPNVLCRIRRDCEPYISSQEEDRKGIHFPSTSSSVLSPDIILRIKHDEDLCCNEENSADSAPRFSGNSSGLPKLLSMKEEELCDKGRDNPSSEYGCLDPPTDVSANKKEKYDMEQKDVQTDEGNSNLITSEANHLVFNPKLSIWIKQVDEPSECVLPVALKANCTAGGNDDKVKSEKDLVPECNKLPSEEALTENISNKENALEKQPIPQKTNSLNKPDHTGKGEESLLSIVLKRANAGSLYMPNYKYSNSYKGLDYPRGIPRTPEKETCYGTKLPIFQTPNSNDLLSSFHARSASANHIAHQVDKPFRCHICEKCFKTLGILNVHMKTHTGVRPYQCNECGKSFRDNWNLKVHQKIHTGETPYKCSTCDKGFIQYATYMKHQRIHTGEKPYSCCYCDKSFTNSSNLVRHHRTHTGEKPYTCVECGKSFSYNTSLIQHKIIHRVELAENGTKDSSNK
ncbi:zinc finger protein 569-like isoform X2 [Pseudophryne corroboree]|uniref:zinc finger protein 569-like isoform X2 n=3 Tax=Pseudophryne corroboree TaxID=495146 RepID=UPI0030817408